MLSAMVHVMRQAELVYATQPLKFPGVDNFSIMRINQYEIMNRISELAAISQQ